MMQRSLLTLLLLAFLVSGIQAQDETPALTSFTTPAASVDRESLVNRSARIPVSWEVANRPLTANLYFEQVMPDGSSINVELPRLIPWVLSSGDGVVAPANPGDDATEITVRVRLVDLLTRTVYDESSFTLPISEGGDPGSNDSVPALTRFTTGEATINRDRLQDGTARIPVTWAAANRPLTANLFFEQILPGTGPVNVELPRSVSWVASSGSGVVAPRDPGDDEGQVWLRVRLVDLVNGRVYDQRDQFITIVDDDTPPPEVEIRLFTPGASEIDESELVNGTARINVTWAVDNRPDNSNLVFEQVLASGDTVNVELPRSEPIVPSSGNGVVAPVPPGGDASEIRLLLRVVDLANDSDLATHEVTLPIVTTPADDAEITSFETSATSVTAAALQDRSARVPVTWSAANRPAGTNLVFEQRLPNGTLINVELPRSVPIVPSSGTGVVAPIWPGSEQERITLTLRMIELSTNQTLDEAEFDLPLAAGDTDSDPGDSDVVINEFSAEPMTVDRNGSVILTWDVDNAASVTIITQRPAGIFGPSYENLSQAGSQAHTIPEENLDSQTFILSVENEAGQQAATETLVVAVRCPFTETYQESCPLTQTDIDAAYQLFENGAMFWRGDTRQIYVLYNDNTYQTFPDTWTIGDPVDSGEEPPDGLMLPGQGFGKVWNEQAGVRDRLGWATAHEAGYTTRLEVYTVPNRPDVIHVELPGGRYAGLPDGLVLALGQNWEVH